MIDQLFGSKTRVKLLQLFFSNVGSSFYVREITRKISEQINSVRRELANLTAIGIVSSDTNNNRLYYEVNQDHEFFKPLLAIFGQTKTPTSDDQVLGETDKQLRALGSVNLAVLTGCFTRDESSGVDLLLVGAIKDAKLKQYIDKLEHEQHREIRYTVMPRQEFMYRRQVNDRFVSAILRAKKQIILDSDHILTK